MRLTGTKDYTFSPGSRHEPGLKASAVYIPALLPPQIHPLITQEREVPDEERSQIYAVRLPAPHHALDLRRSVATSTTPLPSW